MKFEEKKKRLRFINELIYILSYIGLFVSTSLLFFRYSIKLRIILLATTSLFRITLFTKSNVRRFQLETSLLNQYQDLFFLFFSVLFFVSTSYPISYIVYNIIVFSEYIVFELDESTNIENIFLISKINSFFSTFYLSYIIHILHFAIAIELAMKCYFKVSIFHWISCYFYIFWFMLYSITQNSIVVLFNRLTLNLNHETQQATIVPSPGVHGNIVIPRYIIYLHIRFPVTKISKFAFRSIRRLDSIEFEEKSNIQTIECHAFTNAKNIRKITLPDNVIDIEGFFFSELTIPINEIMITTQSKHLIYHDDMLLQKNNDRTIKLIYVNKHRSTIKIPFNINIIGHGAFAHSSKLKQISFETNPQTNGFQLTEIHESSFMNCINLKSVILPNTVRIIDRNAFFRCTSLKEIVLSDNIEIISDFSFTQTSITSITIPANVNTIGKYAFFGCEQLTEVFLNDKLKTISDFAFSKTPLTSIYIPSSVKTIGRNVFDNCIKLLEIKFSKKPKLKWVHERTFSNTFITRLFNLNNHHFKYINDQLLIDKSNNKSLLLFANRDIQVANIPSGIKAIGLSAFHQCYSLKYVHFEMDENGLTNLALIHDYAFSYCKSLVMISIPSTVKMISKSSFSHCEKLQKVKFRTDCNGNCKLLYIDDDAFSYTAIKSLNIPHSATCSTHFCRSANQLESLELRSPDYIFAKIDSQQLQLISLPRTCKVSLDQLSSCKSMFVHHNTHFV